MERYEKIRVLGQGAFGKVFLCKRRADSSLIVIKQITVDELQTEDRRQAMNEVQILSMLKHPNIIAYFDSFVEDKSLMIAMEYAPGGTLFEFIQERNGRLLEEEHILQFFAQLVVAIEHVHSLNILHRDLKTQNIMLNRKRKVLKIGDFGISKVLSSKITSAQTVVGTPSYISPEICEGKLYKKKSDIWALGCILYELTTLKKAFEGPNLSALVLKIMQGLAAVVPVDRRYSKGLQELIHSQLRRNPDDRPSIESVMATPIMVNTLVNLCTDIGRLPCSRSVQEPSSSSDVGGRGHPPPHCTRMGSLGQFRQRSFFEDDYQTSKQETGVKVVSKPQVYNWGDGLLVPTILPSLPDSQIVGVGAGRMQRAGITEDGKLVFWQQLSGSLGTTRLTMQKAGAQKREPAVFSPRLVGVGISAVIKKVACGDMYTAFLTSTGILMTFGSGVNGCLGHGDCDDVTEPRMVEGLLKFETSDFACGSHHMMAITTENTLYTWGKGDSGQLGLGSHDSHCYPQLVSLPEGHTPLHASCGTDSSLLVTSGGDVLATGCNRYNKLALDFQGDETTSEDIARKDVEGKGDRVTSPNTQKLRASPETQDQGAPAILSLTGETPDLMSSSLILSSIKRKDSLLVDGQGPSITYPPPSPGARRGTVGEVLVFQPAGSSILKSETILSAAIGTGHTAFVTASGGCITCGDNGCGQLGRRCEKGDRNPAMVTSLRGQKVEKVACGDFFTAAATADGDVWCWGKGKRGRLGRELEEDSFDPQMVTLEQPHTVQSLACSHTMTLLVATPRS